MLLCCIGKDDNKYVREYIQWYIQKGVDKIVIFDNNEINGERFEEVIGDYIDSGIVDIIDYRGQKYCQGKAYKECYNNYSPIFDWIAFFDLDEFIEFECANDFGGYLSNPRFKNFSMIHINWMCYSDNDQVYYEDKPVINRFPNATPYDHLSQMYPFPHNNHIKSIIRCRYRCQFHL